MSIRILVLVALGALVGCPPVSDQMGGDECEGPCLDIDPRHHDFGTVPAGNEVIRGWTLTAVGTEPVTIHDVRLEGPSSLSLDESLLTSTVEPGGSTWVRVGFAPRSEELMSGTLSIDSDDPLEPAVAIPLVGLGVAPVIEVTPEVWDAGSPDVGCDQATTVQVRNIGSAPLTLQTVALVSPSGEFVEEHPFEDATVLQPLALQSISVFYRPLDEDPDEAELTVVCDDPIQPEVIVDLAGDAQFAGLVEDSFVVQGEAAADLLFVIDNTETMAWYQAGLGVYVGALVDSLVAAAVDAQVGVITTDDPVLVGPLLGPAAPDFAEAFAAQVDVGLLGDPWEQGLGMARDAVTPPLTDPGGDNEGLLRDTAALHVLVLSDTGDHSGGAVADLLDALAATQPAPAFLTVHAMTGQGAGCSGIAGDAGPAPRYEEAVALTGGRSASIREMDWEAWLAGVPWQPPHVDGTFALSAEPVAETLEVTVDGVPAEDGWSLDPYDPVIVFEPAALPPLGAVVTVRYARAGDC